MKLKVIGTGSKGNAYALVSSSGEVLLLECGMPLTDVKQAIDWMIGDVVGVLLTHEHGDHSGYVQEFLRARLRVYASSGTIAEISRRCELREIDQRMLHPVSSSAEIDDLRVFGFRVIPFKTYHDSVDPLGFLIYHEECGKLLFCTDTSCLPHKFVGLSNIMIECNYNLDMADKNFFSGLISPSMFKRLEDSHMSLEDCKAFLSNTDLSSVRNIILVHLSEKNSDPEVMKNEILMHNGIQPHIATNGLELDLGEIPF